MAQASAEKLEHTGPAEKERVATVPQREQLANTVRRSRPCQKEKEQSHQSRVPDHEGRGRVTISGKAKIGTIDGHLARGVKFMGYSIIFVTKSGRSNSILLLILEGEVGLAK